MRNVVVTGGGTGIGRTTAEWFAHHGDQVYIVGRRTDVLHDTAEAIGARAVPGDLGNPAAVTDVVSDLPATVDVLVNNAGGNTDFDYPSGDSACLLETLQSTADRWNVNWTSNVLSAVLATTALTSRFADGARVINIGSIAAPQGAGSYGAAKAALESWTVALATELGPRTITANLVAPAVAAGRTPAQDQGLRSAGAFFFVLRQDGPLSTAARHIRYRRQIRLFRRKTVGRGASACFHRTGSFMNPSCSSWMN